MSKLTHFDEHGRAHMVDVGEKPTSARRAVAEGRIAMSQTTLELILSGDHKKGDVIGIARVAGIMAAKRTPDLIPLCHPLNLSSIKVELVSSYTTSIFLILNRLSNLDAFQDIYLSQHSSRLF